MEDVLAYSVRVILIFFLTYFGARILTKKAVAQMTSYELAGVILLTTVAAEPLVTKVVTKALFGTGLLIALILLISYLTLNNKLNPILEHNPEVVVKAGQIDMGALRNTSLSTNQLMGMLRQQGYDKVTDVEYAILEPHGNISVIPKSQKRPVTPEDLKIPTQYEGLTLPLVVDKRIVLDNLRHINLTEEWLLGELKKKGVTDHKSQVSLVELDTQGNLLISWL